MQEALIKIGGMSCQGCVRSVTQALSQLEGVADVSVSLEQGRAVVHFDPARQSAATLQAAVAAAGFDITG